MIACLWVEILSWDLVVQFNGPRRLEGQQQCHQMLYMEIDPHKSHLLDLIILNIYVLLTLTEGQNLAHRISSCLMINMLAVTAKQPHSQGEEEASESCHKRQLAKQCPVLVK
jgi:hypothetical protein